MVYLPLLKKKILIIFTLVKDEIPWWYLPFLKKENVNCICVGEGRSLAVFTVVKEKNIN